LKKREREISEKRGRALLKESQEKRKRSEWRIGRKDEV